MAMEKRLLLIEPPYYRLFKSTYSLSLYPLSLGYLAGAVRKNTDWHVTVYNADFCPEDEPLQNSYLTGPGYENYLQEIKSPSSPLWAEIETRIREQNPSVVGISAKSQNYAAACHLARFIKKISPDITVIVGGPHPTMVGAEVLDCRDIDICVRGEGEETLVELLRALEGQRDFENVPGIVFRKGQEQVETPARKLIENLDSLAFPHEKAQETLLDFEKYPKSAFGNIFSIRGCPYNCFYCGSRNIWTRKARYRSPQNVVDEIRSIRKLGTEAIAFLDDTFGIHKKYITELCEALIREIPGLKWSCELHVNLVTDETMALMRKAGCQTVYMGVESGNNEILQKIRKGYTIEKAHEAAKIIKRHGITLYTFYMVGFPWETEHSLNDTIKSMRTIKNDLVIYSIFMPYPKTEAFEYCKAHGLVGDHFDVSLYNHQSPANCFVKDMSLEQFRKTMNRVEKMVDRRNAWLRLRENMSVRGLNKIRRMGVSTAFKRLRGLLPSLGSQEIQL